MGTGESRAEEKRKERRAAGRLRERSSEGAMLRAKVGRKAACTTSKGSDPEGVGSPGF